MTEFNEYADETRTNGTIRGTTAFWGSPHGREMEHHHLGRTCALCGESVCDRTRGELCISCANRARFKAKRQAAALVALSLARKAAGGR